MASIKYVNARILQTLYPADSDVGVINKERTISIVRSNC